MNFSSLESLADNELIDQLQQLGDAARQGSIAAQNGPQRAAPDRQSPNRVALLESARLTLHADGIAPVLARLAQRSPPVASRVFASLARVVANLAFDHGALHCERSQSNDRGKCESCNARGTAALALVAFVCPCVGV